MIPTVETERLRLRAHRLDDFSASFAMWTDPRMTRFIGGNASSEQQTWARILAYRGHWELLHFGYWAIEDRATGAFIGEIGFADFHRDVVPAMRDVPEIGWALVGSMHGKGLGSEAARAAVGWGDEHLPYPRTVCMIDPDNAPSIRIAQKCGYAVFAHETYAQHPILFLERAMPS